MCYGDMYATETIRKASPDAQARVTMTVNGFKASLMRAKKLEDNGNKHGLPSGEQIPVFPVDMLPGCPDEWLREPGSYVCPVDPEWGLWFDWTMNSKMNTAVLPTVKGMNPITGQKLDGLALEEYKEKCPVHKEKFQGDERFCEKCGYKWPAQSYVCAPNTLWWDGFRQADGSVRQFFFSEDEAKDIASLVIGKKSTVPAFGFAFFNPKVARDDQVHGGIVFSQEAPNWLTKKIGASVQGTMEARLKHLLGPRDSLGASGASGFKGVSGHSGSSAAPNVSCSTNQSATDARMESNIAESMVEPIRAQVEYPTTLGIVQPEFSLPQKARDRSKVRVGRKRAAPVRSVAVGAGAMIRQDLSPDTLSVADWKEESAGIIRLYFCFKPQFESIVGKGVKNVDGDKEGFMKGLPTG